MVTVNSPSHDPLRSPQGDRWERHGGARGARPSRVNG